MTTTPPAQPGIYGLRSTSQQRLVYIGSTINLQTRRNSHLSRLRNANRRGQSLLLIQHAERFGPNDLTFEVLEYCSSDTLIEREDALIELHGTHKNNGGYNVRLRCDSNSGLTGKEPWNKGGSLSERHRKRIAKAMKKVYKDPAVRQRVSDAKLGKSIASKGKPTGRTPTNALPCRLVHRTKGEIGTYKSTSEAARVIGINIRHANTVRLRGTTTRSGYSILSI